VGENRIFSAYMTFHDEHTKLLHGSRLQLVLGVIPQALGYFRKSLYKRIYPDTHN
jgi:hypothetical protein